MPALARAGAALLVMLGAVPLASQTAVSIYGDGRAVVRLDLPQPLVRGRNPVTLTLEGVDPAMLFSPDTSVSVSSAVLRAPSDRDGALAASLGQVLAFVHGSDTVRATVVRVHPPQYRLADGRLLLAEPGEPLFPPERVRTVPELALELEATRPRPRTELVYVAEGARWRATYAVLLGGEENATASVTGTATIESDALRLDSAIVQLVAGSIARAGGARPPAPLMARAAFAPAADFEAQTAEAAVGEVHVYSLPGRYTVEPGVASSVALFPRARVAVTEELVVPGALPFRGYLASGGADPYRVPVQVWYTLDRARGTPFGDRPLPGGTVELYQADSTGAIELVGEARSDHTAPGRALRVQSGDAFDVTAERVQTDYAQEALPPLRRGLPATQRVTVTNAKPRAVTVDVRETRGGAWSVVTSSLAPEKLSSSEVRFLLPVPAAGSATLTYTVQVDS